nr:MAG TPA: hypothetical protein [Caudoviricetes sp.]
MILPFSCSVEPIYSMLLFSASQPSLHSRLYAL